MGYALMWVESLAAAVLFLTASIAWIDMTQSRWLKLALRVAFSCVAVGLFIAGCFLSYISFYGFLKLGWLIYVLSWIVALAAITTFVRRAGSQKEDGVSRSRNWPRSRLLLGSAAGVVLTSMTFWNIDTAGRLRLAALAYDADAQVAAISPGFVPDRDNAALIYEKAFEEIKRPELQDFNRLRNLAWPKKPEKGDAFLADPHAAEFFAKCQPLIKLLKKASAMPNCSFDHDYLEGDRMLAQAPELGEFRTQAQLLAMDARFKAANGKVAEAFEDIFTIDLIAAHAGNGPFLICGWVTCSMEELSAQTLERVLTTTVPSSAELAVMPADNPVIMNRVFRRGIKGEQAMALSAFSMFADGRMPTYDFNELRLNSLAPVWRVFLMPDDLQTYESLITPMIQNSKNSLMSLRTNAKAMEWQFGALRSTFMTRAMVPALERSVTHFTRIQAKQRMSKLALAVAAYQAKHAELPGSLEVLIPEFIAEIPNDPFTETPLHFKKSDGKVVLYSVGINLVDDGGIETEDISKGDILFKIGIDSKNK